MIIISGDIIIYIVKPGFCSMHYTVILAKLKNVNRHREYRFMKDCYIRVSLYQGSHHRYVSASGKEEKQLS